MAERSPKFVVGNSNTVFISRRPIYNQSGAVCAYELVYDCEALTRMLAPKDPKAAFETFSNTFLKGAVEPLGDGTTAFIRMSRAFILQNYCKSLTKHGIVLEVTQLELDDVVNSYLTELRTAGYTIALDNFDFSVRPPDFVNTVKIPFEKLPPPNDIAQMLTMLKQSKVKAIVTEVESHEQLELAKSLGFEYYAGLCFTKPKGIKTDQIPVNRLATLQLIMKLQDPDLKTSELEQIVKQDLAISFKLMRFVNSAALSLSRSIDSIKTAIQLVGTNRLRSWASLLFLSRLEDKTSELISTALTRAKMAESLAVAMGVADPDTYYMVGLFSLVDALLNVPMSEATQLLPFSSNVRDALINLGGTYGSVLKCVLAYERGDWAGVTCGNLDPGAIRHCYLVSVAGAGQMLKMARANLA